MQAICMTEQQTLGWAKMPTSGMVVDGLPCLLIQQSIIKSTTLLEQSSTFRLENVWSQMNTLVISKYSSRADTQHHCHFETSHENFEVDGKVP